jgi:hypothetical protein
MKLKVQSSKLKRMNKDKASKSCGRRHSHEPEFELGALSFS